jgi:hypothetical protein
MKKNFRKCLPIAGMTLLLLPGIGLLGTEQRSFAEEINIIKNGGFETGLAQWSQVQGHKEQFRFTVDGTIFFTGSQSLRIESLPPHANDMYAWIGQSVALKKGKTYKLSFYVYAGSKTRGKQEIHLHWPGQRTYSPYEIDASGPADWHNWHKQEFYFVAQSNRVTLNIPFAGSGKMWIDEIILTEVPFSGSTGSIMRHGRIFTYQPRGKIDSPLSLVSAEEKENGYITYLRKNPRDTYSWSIPQKGEITKDIAIFATPGESVSAWFSIYALNKLSGVRVSIPDTLNKMDGFSKEHIELRTVRSWEQRTGWRSTSYYIIPELLEKKSSVDIQEGRTQSFWLTIRIPKDMAAGEYPLKISIDPDKGGKGSLVTLTITVLPFTLKKPEGIHWSMWWASRGYEKISVTDMKRELADINEHGVKSLLVDISMFRDSTFKKTKDGMHYFSAKLLEIQKIRKELQMNGPLILYFGDQLEPQVLESFGKDMSALYTKESMDLITEAMKAVDRFVKETGGEEYGDWYFLGMDEPGAHAARQERTLLQYTLAKKAVIKTTTTINRSEFTKKIMPIVTSMCWAGTPSDDETNKYYQNLGPEYWSYGSGVYTGQEGGIVPNRYICGFLFYKMQAKLQMSFMYARTGYTEDPYDDFDGNSYVEPKDAYIAYPSSDGPVPTLQWEGIREGINDYRYMYTLEQLLMQEEQKEEKSRVKRFAEVKERWQELVRALSWRTSPEKIENAYLLDLRKEVIDLILKLITKKTHEF